MTQKPQNTLRFGILCDSHELQRWQMMAVESLLSDGHTLSIVVMNTGKAESVSMVKKWRKYPFRNLLFRVWYRFFLKPESKKLHNAQELFANTPIFHETPVRKGIACYFTEACIEAVKQTRTDFLLRFGFGIIRGEILQTPPLGIWSFHHDDPTVVRGVPSNFWEIYEKIDINGAILQQIDESIDAGRIIWKGYFPTIHHSWKANIDQAYFGSTSWPALVCRQLMADRGSYTGQAPKSKPSPMRFAPGNYTMIKFLWILAVNRFRYHIKDLFIAEKWAIGYAKANFDDIIGKKAEAIEWKWLEGPRSRQYHADVSGFVLNAELKLLSEFYDYRYRLGKIMLTEPASGISRTVIEKMYHLAFPYVFEENGVIYCIPETSASGQVELYRYNTVTSTFDFEHVLMKEIRAVDPVLFVHDGLWWLLFTGKDHSNYELHAWYSKEMKGPYSPHRLNPVKTDPRSSRPAGGVIRQNGRLLRPAQDCSTYSGHRIAINEIKALSPDQFEEETVFHIEPGQNRNYPHGLHTLNIAGPYVLVDAKRHTFIFYNLLHKIREKIKKMGSF